MLGRQRSRRMVMMGVLIVVLLALMGGVVAIVTLVQRDAAPVERTISLGAMLAPIPIAPLVDEDNGRVFILGYGPGTENGVRMGILDGVDGRLVRTVPLPTFSLALLALDRRHNRLIATGNAITILDATSGGVLRVLVSQDGPQPQRLPARHTTIINGKGPQNTIFGVNKRGYAKTLMLYSSSARPMRRCSGTSSTLTPLLTLRNSTPMGWSSAP